MTNHFDNLHDAERYLFFRDLRAVDSLENKNPVRDIPL